MDHFFLVHKGEFTDARWPTPTSCFGVAVSLCGSLDSITCASFEGLGSGSGCSLSNINIVDLVGSSGGSVMLATPEPDLFR